MHNIFQLKNKKIFKKNSKKIKKSTLFLVDFHFPTLDLRKFKQKKCPKIWQIKNSDYNIYNIKKNKKFLMEQNEIIKIIYVIEMFTICFNLFAECANHSITISYEQT